MAKICIVTDSTADIPRDIAEQWDIHIVPLKVHIGGETYLDGVTIRPEAFFERLAEAETFPSTSQPSPIDFQHAYEEIVREHGPETQILSIHLSSALSGTYQSAHLAKTMVQPHPDITVIDSKKAAYLLGMIVVEAAKAAKEGKTKEGILSLAESMIMGQKNFFVVDTLTYLHKGGRIGKAQALLGTLLNVKPILSINESGEVYPFDKVRGKKKAVSRIFEELHQYAGNDKVKVAVLYAMNRGEAEMLAERIREQFDVEEMTLSEIGPVIGAHVGPEVLAVSMYKEGT